MNLKNFISKKEKVEKKLIFEDKDIIIYNKGDKKIYNFKTKKGLLKYQNEVFATLTNSKNINDKTQLLEFLEQSEKDNVEGIMLKVESAKYKSGLRVNSMYKLKKVKDTLDLVIMSAEMGTGKRVGFFSSFIVGVIDQNYLEQENKFLEIGRVSSGIKELSGEDTSMDNLTKLLTPLITKKQKEITYFRPNIIIEVGYQEIQKSTIYKSGFALRFPRIKLLRKDKPVEEITTIRQIKNL